MGLIRTANHKAEMDAGSVYFDMHHENKNLNAFFGCGKESL